MSVEQAARIARRMRFGVFEIDLEAGELSKNSRKVRLQEQPFQVLARLLHHPGKLVTREDLQKQIWPRDTFVDFDLGLNTAIKKLRAALGDSAENPKYVETLPKRGYRFICPVEEVAEETSQPSADAGDAGATAGSPAPRISRAARYRRPLTMGTAAIVVLLLGFGFVRLQNRFRHNEARTPEPMNSISDERMKDRGTRDQTAWTNYLSGVDFQKAYDRPNKDDKAIEAFERAVHADPQFAAAFAGTARAYWNKFVATNDEQWADKAIKNCDQAFVPKPTQAAAWICLGTIHYGQELYKKAVDDFDAALEIDPDSSPALRGRAFAQERLGRTEAAENDFLQAIHYDPLYWYNHCVLASFYRDHGRFPDAIGQYEKAREITPDNSEALSSLGAVYLQAGDYDKAVSMLTQASRMRPTLQDWNNLAMASLNLGHFEDAASVFRKAVAREPNDYRGYGNLARALFWAGHPQPALESYLRAIQLAKLELSAKPDDHNITLSLATYYSMLWQPEEAVDYLERATQSSADAETAFWAGVIRNRLGDRQRAIIRLGQAVKLGYPVAEINAVPELETLRRTPEFQEAIRSGGHTVILSANPDLNRRDK